MTKVWIDTGIWKDKNFLKVSSEAKDAFLYARVFCTERGVFKITLDFKDYTSKNSRPLKEVLKELEEAGLLKKVPNSRNFVVTKWGWTGEGGFDGKEIHN
jgi:hypothetical protein